MVATTRATCVDSRETIGMHRGEGDRCHYWAKGTGFGTGSTTQSWDVEQALVRQKVEEEHVVWLVRLLAQYINPGAYFRIVFEEGISWLGISFRTQKKQISACSF